MVRTSPTISEFVLACDAFSREQTKKHPTDFARVVTAVAERHAFEDEAFGEFIHDLRDAWRSVDADRHVGDVMPTLDGRYTVEVTGMFFEWYISFNGHTVECYHYR